MYTETHPLNKHDTLRRLSLSKFLEERSDEEYLDLTTRYFYIVSMDGELAGS